jgi:hypothetical protein
VMVAPALARWVAGLTILFGLPLYFTKLIRETRFPEGMPFVFVYTWGLIAVVALPILLFVLAYFLLRGLRAGERGSLFINVFALCFGVAAECVFLLARR